MSYKIGNDTVYIANEKSGVFANVYYQNVSYNMVLTNGFIGGADAWFNPNGDAKFSQVEGVNAFQYTQAMGFTSGYVLGGYDSDLGDLTNSADKFPFASTPVSVTNVGTLSTVRAYGSSHSSLNDGFISGGSAAPSGSITNVDKFPFASTPVSVTNVGALAVAKTSAGGHSSTTNGYVSGGATPSSVPGVNTIDKFPFTASFATASSLATLTAARRGFASHSSQDYGYVSGGLTPASAALTNFERFSFASDTNGASVGSLTLARYNVRGLSSAEHGYAVGGQTLPGTVPRNTIDRFPFAVAPATSASVGALTTTKYGAGTVSSITDGYALGENNAGGGPIDKFPFAAQTTNASNVGSINARQDMTGHQV